MTELLIFILELNLEEIKGVVAVVLIRPCAVLLSSILDVLMEISIKTSDALVSIVSSKQDMICHQPKGLDLDKRLSLKQYCCIYVKQASANLQRHFH